MSTIVRGSKGNTGHDEVYDAFPATIQKLDEDENIPEDTAAQDDQEDET